MIQILELYFLHAKIMDWISFDEHRPHDGQRCLVCYKPWERVIILIYNFIYDCWDDDEADDYLCKYDKVDFWCPLPDYKK